jgi:hypothetical protein
VKAAACATAALQTLAARLGNEMLRPACAAQGLPPIDRQEDGACQGQGLRQAWTLAQRLGHAQHTRGNEDGVGHGAEQHDAADMLATQALAQHEDVLRTDGHDQAQAQGHALHEDREGERVGFWQVHDVVSLPVALHKDKLSHPSAT